MSTANKVDDLEPVPIGQRCLRPRGSRNDIAIMFDRYAIAFQPNRSNQLLEEGRRRQLRELPRLAIENKVHNGRTNTAGEAQCPESRRPGSRRPGWQHIEKLVVAKGKAPTGVSFTVCSPGRLAQARQPAPHPAESRLYHSTFEIDFAIQSLEELNRLDPRIGAAQPPGLPDPLKHIHPPDTRSHARESPRISSARPPSGEKRRCTFGARFDVTACLGCFRSNRTGKGACRGNATTGVAGTVPIPGESLKPR